jgi:hypothetical protein
MRIVGNLGKERYYVPIHRRLDITLPTENTILGSTRYSRQISGNLLEPTSGLSLGSSRSSQFVNRFQAHSSTRVSLLCTLSRSASNVSLYYPTLHVVRKFVNKRLQHSLLPLRDATMNAEISGCSMIGYRSHEQAQTYYAAISTVGRGTSSGGRHYGQDHRQAECAKRNPNPKTIER